MDVMKRYPDNYFDLAIVDPPYFSGPEKRKFYGRKVSPIGVSRLYGETSEWQIPNRDYFDELFRVSKNQIIWGVNYFNYSFGSGRIVWDKVNGHPTQKPINLYFWLLQNYAKAADKILDTHVGSASSLIACQELGFEYVGCELDKNIFNFAQQRLENYKSQIKLF